MGIVRRLREAGAAFMAQRVPTRALDFSVSLPGRAAPRLRFQASSESRPVGDGHVVHLRAHWSVSAAGHAGPGLSSWLELRASDAALDAGSRALVPEQLAQLGVAPPDDKPVHTWAGPLPSRAGLLVLSLLRLDRRDLPAWLQRRLGDKPFQLAATLATAVEDGSHR